MPVADATRSQLRNEAKRRAREAAARRRAEAAARRRAEEARRREARRRARQARLAAQQANETRATPGGPTRAGRVREAREAAGSGVQRAGRAGHPRGPRRSRARATTGSEAYPALDALFSTRAGRGDLLTPEQFENWRVEQGNFTTRRGKRGARAPSYADYLSFVERRRGLRGRPELRERVARGEFASPVRAARQEEEFPAGLYGRLPTSTADALARNARNAVEPDDDGFLDEIRDAFGEVWGAVRPGGKLDDTLGAGGRLDRALGMGSAAGKVQEFSGWLDSQGDRFEDWLRSYLGDRKISVSTAPGLVVDDVDAASIAAVPVKIPTQIASALAYTPAFAAFAVSDPKGTAEGIAQYASQIWDDPSGFLLDRPGDALMLLLGGKGLVSGRLPRVVSAAARGDVRAAARAAVAPAPSTGALTRGTPLARVSPERLVPGGRERRIVRERELVARIESAEPEVLVKLANQLVIPKLPHVSKRQALVAQSEAIRAVLEQTSPRMRAAFFLDSRTFTRPAARYQLNKLVTGNQIVEALGLVERGPDGVLRISDKFPALQALTERVRRSSVRQEGKKIELGMLNPETAAVRRDTPARIMGLPDEADVGPTVYTPYKVDDLIIRPALPQKIRDRLGIPQKPGRHEFTGRSMRSGRVGNVVRLTAREELATLRYQGRLDAWKDAVKSSITGKELLNRIKNGESLSDYAAVRVKAGKSTLATSELLTNLFGKIPIDSARNFLDITSGPLGDAAEAIRLIVRDADKSGQVRFFKPGEVGLRPLEMSRPGTIRATAQFVNQMAKTSVLFLAGPAYALPNLIGQWGFSGIHKGVQQPFTDFWDAPRIMGKVAPETRARARVASGTGMTRIIQPGMGPISILRNLNHRLGDFYSRFLDDFWREGAFVYEAKQRGYTTPEDITRLVNTGTKRGTREHTDLLEINRAVDDHFGAFDRMTDFEKNYMQEAVFFWPWIRASAVLAGKVISNHPVKAALLQIGGSYSYEQARQDFISMFTEHGVDRKTAEGMTDDLMRLMPGIFMIGDQAINPMAVALYSSPLEIGRVLGPATKGDWDGFLSNLVDQGTPFVSIAGALIEGVFNPRADPTAQRVLESIQGYSRDATLLRRLFGDQGKWFTFTEAQAYMQRFGGSFMPRGINIEGLEASTKRRLQEEAGPAPPKPHVYETLSDRALNSDRFPDEMKQNIERWRDGQDLIRYGKVTLARQLGLMQTNDPETPSVSRLTRRQEYAIKIGVLNRIRPGYLPGNWRDVYHDVWETHNTDAIERLIRAINTGLSFADVYGASISSRMDEVLNAATK